MQPKNGFPGWEHQRFQEEILLLEPYKQFALKQRNRLSMDLFGCETFTMHITMRLLYDAIAISGHYSRRSSWSTSVY
jgi:hypothetical protein